MDKLTLLHLEILMHYRISNEKFRDNSEGIIEFKLQLCDLELLDERNFDYKITDKGIAWLDHILKTSMPVLEWIWK